MDSENKYVLVAYENLLYMELVQYLVGSSFLGNVLRSARHGFTRLSLFIFLL